MVGGSAALLLTARQSSTDVRMTMLWTLFVVLLLLWLSSALVMSTFRTPSQLVFRCGREAGLQPVW